MKRSTSIRLGLLLACIFGLCLMAPVAAFAEESNLMWRLYNKYTGEHFYTASMEERDSLRGVGWNCEGVGWVAPDSGKEVYRLYNKYAPGGDHHYTLNPSERDALVEAGWTYEGVGWYSGGDVELLRQYNPYAVTGTHNYTTNPDENSALVKLGWRGEGYAWSAISKGYEVSGLGPIEQPNNSGNNGGSNQPSDSSTSVAYLVSGSNVYHTHWCRSMAGATNYKTVSLSEAQASGRRLCKNCAQIS